MGESSQQVASLVSGDVAVGLTIFVTVLRPNKIIGVLICFLFVKKIRIFKKKSDFSGRCGFYDCVFSMIEFICKRFCPEIISFLFILSLSNALYVNCVCCNSWIISLCKEHTLWTLNYQFKWEGIYNEKNALLWLTIEPCPCHFKKKTKNVMLMKIY